MQAAFLSHPVLLRENSGHKKKGKKDLTPEHKREGKEMLAIQEESDGLGRKKTKTAPRFRIKSSPVGVFGAPPCVPLASSSRHERCYSASCKLSTSFFQDFSGKGFKPRCKAKSQFRAIISLPTGFLQKKTRKILQKNLVSISLEKCICLFCTYIP